MHLPTTLALSALLLASFVAADVEDDEVPKECKEVCAPVVSITESCDNKTDDDKKETECVCKGKDMSSILPLCDACIAQNSDDGHDNGEFKFFLSFCISRI